MWNWTWTCSLVDHQLFRLSVGRGDVGSSIMYYRWIPCIACIFYRVELKEMWKFEKMASCHQWPFVRDKQQSIRSSVRSDRPCKPPTHVPLLGLGSHPTFRPKCLDCSSSLTLADPNCDGTCSLNADSCRLLMGMGELPSLPSLSPCVHWGGQGSLLMMLWAWFRSWSLLY